MRTDWKKKSGVALAAAGVIVLLGGCAAKHAAIEHIARADVAIKDTQQTEAQKYASLELHQAQEKLDAAKKARDDGDYKESIQLSEEAMANTQLAEAKVLSEKARENANESRKSTETLKKETKRNRDARQAN